MFDDETVMFKIYFEPFLQKSLFIFLSLFCSEWKASETHFQL